MGDYINFAVLVCCTSSRCVPERVNAMKARALQSSFFHEEYAAEEVPGGASVRCLSTSLNEVNSCIRDFQMRKCSSQSFSRLWIRTPKESMI